MISRFPAFYYKCVASVSDQFEEFYHYHCKSLFFFIVLVHPGGLVKPEPLSCSLVLAIPAGSNMLDTSLHPQCED